MTAILLNKATNTATNDTIRTFQLERVPKYLLAQIGTHRILTEDAEIECVMKFPRRDLSSNAESSRARPIGSVIEQVMMDPAIPLWTKNQKGMVGGELGQDAIDKATNESLKMRDQMVTFVQYLISIGVHKQDANRYLEPWMRVAVLITGTEWDGFYKLRNHPHAQPDFQEYAAEMQYLDGNTAASSINLGDWYKPWPELNLAANTCKAASISYANHAKDRSTEDYQRIHDDLVNADPRHSSPTEHCALAVQPGMLLGTGWPGADWRADIDPATPQVFDPINIGGSIGLCDGSDNWISTANFSGFLQYRKILEAGLKVDVDTGLIL
jgi:hypothetical protein